MVVLLVSYAYSEDTNYYMDATLGSDYNNCTTDTTPCKTLEHLNTKNFEAGDNIYLKRGEIFKGAIITATFLGTVAKPVSIDAYGTGAKPIIAGDDFVNGWVATTGNEFKATLTNRPNIVFANGTWLDNTSNDVYAAFGTNSVVWKAYEAGLGNTYRALLYASSAPPYAVYDNENGIWNALTLGTDKNNLALGSWIYETNQLYVRAGSDVDLTAAPNFYVYSDQEVAGRLPAGSWAYDRNNQELYVRLADGSQPTTDEVSYVARDNNIKLTDTGYITIQNLTLDKSNDASLLFFHTTSKINFTIQDVDIYYYGIFGIRFQGVSQTQTNVTIQDVNIINGTMRGWQYPVSILQGNSVASAIQLGQKDEYPYASFNDILVRRVYINGGNSGLDLQGQSSGRDGITIFNPTTATIEYTEVTGVDHGIHVRGDLEVDACTGIIMRYNYVHDLGDDAMWSTGCYNADVMDFQVYDNLIVNAGDACMGFSESRVYLVNNVCQGWWQSCLALYMPSTVENNICIQTANTDCQLTGHNCFVEMWYAPDGNIDNNLYYDVTGVYGGSFRANGTVYTWAEWQALVAPDANSLWDVDPFFKPDSFGDSELLNAIDDWANGNLVESELFNFIDFWAAGCYYWDITFSSYKAGC